MKWLLPVACWGILGRMRIEMHCHSTHSDGRLPAREVAQRAAAREVVLFCLTDHDSCDGYEATKAVIPTAIRGVELSCVDNGRTVHLLVYQRADSETWHLMDAALLEQKKARRDRVYLIAERLVPFGIVLDSEALLRKIPGSIGRPHIAAELVRMGVVRSKEEAFDRYLKDGGPADVVVARLSLEEGLRLGEASGGCMSLAHPHLYGSGAEDLIRRHLEFGLTGLEVHYSKYKPARRRSFADLADRCGLIHTGGSDFHQDGPGQPVVGIDVPQLAVDKLRTWLGLSA